MAGNMDMASFRNRIDIVQVLGHYLSLHKRGASYMALCPFHADKHPSFSVHPVKGVYRCFSCGAGGDAIRFVEEMEHCSFPEALRICADICRISLPEEEKKADGKRNAPVVPARKVPVVQETGKQSPSPEEHAAYFRSLLPFYPGNTELEETYRSFGVGMAPLQVPGSFGFTRGRIVFPIADADGRIVAFAARYAGENRSGKIAKYLNSPTSEFYKKSELLYGWHKAKGHVRETGIVFLTEGYKDTLAMHAAGFANTVALCGVAFSAAHLALVGREAHTVCLLLDADEAGEASAGMITLLLHKAGLQVVSIRPEGGKDPDEMFRAMGKETFARWVRRRMLSPVRLKAETLLVCACSRWQDTECLLPDGGVTSFVGNIREVLSYRNLLPEDEMNRACLLALPRQETTGGMLPDVPTAICRELDALYERHTVSTHPEPVRRSELIEYLCLAYQEVCLAERVRKLSHNLLHAAKDEKHHGELLSSLQTERMYLREVSGMLGRC